MEELIFKVGTNFFILGGGCDCQIALADFLTDQQVELLLGFVIFESESRSY
jgi:hypothetical protein